jgi:uncharacterized membrane protein
MTVVDEAPLAALPEEPRPDWWQRRYTFTGTAVGLLFLLLSMTPSLLPRGPLFQGIVSGAAGAIGYALGVLAVWLVRFMRSQSSSPPAPRWAWTALLVLSVLGVVLGVVYFHYWQDHVRDLFGVPRLKWYNYIQAGVLSVVLLFTFVEIGQSIGRLVRFLSRQLARVAPPRVSFVVTVALLLSLGIAILNGVVLQRQRRDGPQPSGTHHRAALRRPGVAGVLGLAGPSGPHLPARRPDRRPVERVQQGSSEGADPRLRRPELRQGNSGDRGTGGRRT